MAQEAELLPGPPQVALGALGIELETEDLEHLCNVEQVLLQRRRLTPARTCPAVLMPLEPHHGSAAGLGGLGVAGVGWWL